MPTSASISISCDNTVLIHRRRNSNAILTNGIADLRRANALQHQLTLAHITDTITNGLSGGPLSPRMDTTRRDTGLNFAE